MSVEVPSCGQELPLVFLVLVFLVFVFLVLVLVFLVLIVALFLRQLRQSLIHGHLAISQELQGLLHLLFFVFVTVVALFLLALAVLVPLAVNVPGTKLGRELVGLGKGWTGAHEHRKSSGEKEPHYKG